MTKVIYDLEVFPNFFSCAAVGADDPFRYYFEISDWRNDSAALREWLSTLTLMIGFNNVSFDYPVLHRFIEMDTQSAQELYAFAKMIITTQDENRFANMIYPSDRHVPQLDLFKLHHFDNKARMTSLKVLEFSMRMDSVEDLPFPVGTVLTAEQAQIMRGYNEHDVDATKQFYLESLPAIHFRETLVEKYPKQDWLNFNDTKIGAEIFQMQLEAAKVECYAYGPDGRKPRQTLRPRINLAECIPEWNRFEQPEFNRIKEYFISQTITETKGVFTNLSARVDGLDFVYGVGGLHASVENSIFAADSEFMILDMDVTSLYPSIAIEHGIYPEHLGPKFIDVYRDLRTQRMSFKKGTAENAALKLALNGTYGKTNDKFSIFYDPLYTMKITIGGQMMISMLAEALMGIGVQIIQVNTDGITVFVRRFFESTVKHICEEWEALTKLQLEYVEYSKMCIRDVNNYLAVKLNGEVKRKGAYDFEKEWHQDASALVVAKVTEKVLLEDISITESVESWPDRMDFMCRVKVPRSSHLHALKDGKEYVLPNMTRYYVSKGGYQLVKLMPPLKGKSDWRRINVESGWTVCPCNDIRQAVLPIDYTYYIDEIEKLVLPLKEN
jgi:hypothetical protein